MELAVARARARAATASPLVSAAAAALPIERQCVAGLVVADRVRVRPVTPASPPARGPFALALRGRLRSRGDAEAEFDYVISSSPGLLVACVFAVVAAVVLAAAAITASPFAVLASLVPAGIAGLLVGMYRLTRDEEGEERALLDGWLASLRGEANSLTMSD
jgi:hypothetical protein